MANIVISANNENDSFKFKAGTKDEYESFVSDLASLFKNVKVKPFSQITKTGKLSKVDTLSLYRDFNVFESEVKDSIFSSYCSRTSNTGELNMMYRSFKKIYDSWKRALYIAVTENGYIEII